MAFQPLRGRARPVTAPPSQAKRKVGLTIEDYEVQAVTVVPEGEDGNRNTFSVTLEIDLPAGRVGTRRKEGVRSIILPVEVKDIPVLCSLAGRPLGILHWIDEELKDQDELYARLTELEKERDGLLHKLEEMRKQVHFLVEGSR